MKKLPIGISTLAEIRANDYVFIDKTRHVANLVSAGKYYFLSRPRRFGKSGSFEFCVGRIETRT